jgi:hypothetical protein
MRKIKVELLTVCWTERIRFPKISVRLEEESFEYRIAEGYYYWFNGTVFLWIENEIPATNRPD